eukprot:2082168-Prorocentrum_lima.AAC.1
MTSSLVGSEMCIRDRYQVQHGRCFLVENPRGSELEKLPALQAVARHPVSYTHLTLPTICSV